MLMHSESLITTAEAAVILGISKATVTRWVHSGRIKPEFTLSNGQIVFKYQYVLDVAVGLAFNALATAEEQDTK
jgi:excisionase family DNA binding protein